MEPEELAALVGHRFPGGNRRIEHWESWLLTDCTGRDPMPDGLTNVEERDNFTDPSDPDSDDDGLLDGAEVKTHGTLPLVPGDSPGRHQTPNGRGPAPAAQRESECSSLGWTIRPRSSISGSTHACG